MKSVWDVWTHWMLIMAFDLWRYPDAAPRRDEDAQP